jgi:hypothetical protein
MRNHNERKLRTKEYTAWCHMRRRCNNSKTPQYNDYGGRGIIVCERWDSYLNFLSDVGRAPTSNHSLDRIKTDGNYEPGNVKWSTMQEQNENKRSNVRIEINGEIRTLQAWSNFYGIDRNTVKFRIKKRWPKELWFTKEPYTGNRINKKQKLSFYKNGEL